MIMQKKGKVKIPDGKKVAVALSCDFDAQCVWMGGLNQPTPYNLMRGEYGAFVGLPRLLDLYNKYEIRTTFFTPGHTIDTYSDICKDILDRGHEMGYHGYAHHPTSHLPYEEEDVIFHKGLEALARIGVKPAGARCDFSFNTSSILEKYDFKYSSCLPGNDLYPYYPRKVEVNYDKGNVYGPASTVLDLPWSYHTDDFPFVEYVPELNFDIRPSSELYNRWTTMFDYAARHGNSMLIFVCHPQAIGHPENIMTLERIINYFLENDAWITTCEEISDSFVLDPDYKE